MLELYVTTQQRLEALISKLTTDRGSDTVEKAIIIGVVALIATALGVAIKAYVDGKIAGWG